MNLQDKTGYQTLEVISKADKFNRWMYESIRPYCRGNILEIGSGIGNISHFFIQDNYSVTLSDTDDFYFDQLKKKFDKANVFSIDLVDEDFNKKYKDIFETFDTVIFLNVLEHIKNDELAIKNCRRFLKPGGSLVVLVPAYSFLLSKMDKELKHYRRYSPKRISALLAKRNFSVRKVFYFNALGILAWMYGKIWGLSSIPPGDMKLFNKLIPFAKLIDKFLFKKAGLSIIAVAQKDL